MPMLPGKPQSCARLRSRLLAFALAFVATCAAAICSERAVAAFVGTRSPRPVAREAACRHRHAVRRVIDSKGSGESRVVNVGRVRDPPRRSLVARASAGARDRRLLLALGLMAAAVAKWSLGYELSWPSPAFFEQAATAGAVLFTMSPIAQMLELYRSKGGSLDTVNPQTMNLMFLNASLWVIWGVFSPMWPVVAANFFGVVAAFSYLSCCWGYALFKKRTSATWGRFAAFGTCGALLSAAVLTAYASTSTARAQNVGILATLVGSLLAAAPLSVVGQVLRDKSSKLLPPVQCSAQFLNTALWLTVGLNSNALQLILCNGLGFACAVMQLGLIARYPQGDGKKAGP